MSANTSMLTRAKSVAGSRVSQRTSVRASAAMSAPAPKASISACTSVFSGKKMSGEVSMRRAASRNVHRRPLTSNVAQPMGMADGEGAPAPAATNASKSRWAMVFCLFCAFVLCNLDKVNMSVAIVPMAESFKWTGTEKGLVQSAFFWGYMFTQLPGGFLASKVGGKQVLLWGVLLWSFGTLIAPACANMGLTALLASRFIVGLGEGVAPAAATGVLASTIPNEERSRATSAVFGGLDVGSLTGLLIAPPIILQLGGWPAVFYLFGAAGFVWAAWWFTSHCGANSVQPLAGAAEGNKGSTPWKALMSNPDLFVISAVHFTWNWFSYGLLAYMPSFFKDALGFNLTKSSMLSILPYASTLVAMLFVGTICDGLVKRGTFSLAGVRKLSQSICFLGGAVASAGIGFTLMAMGGTPSTGGIITIMSLLVFTFFCGAFSRTGLFCCHQDINPKYASINLGFTNTIAAFASAMATFCIGALLDYTNNNWALSLFFPLVCLNVLATTIFVFFYKGTPVDYDAMAAEEPKKIEVPADEPAASGNGTPPPEENDDEEDGSKKEKLILFGVTCPDNRAIQFTILTVGSLVCSIGFSALQEMVTRVPGFKFSGWMTLITTLAYALCALIEMVATKGKIEKKASWGNYVLLSTLTFGGMYATNYALKFLNYATRIVAKSSKVIPVMLFSTIINGKKYNWKEWGAVFLLVVGITLFTLGDVASMPAFNPIGIVLITASLCIDAVTSNFEEKVFFRVKTPSSHSEVLLFASLFGSVWSLASCWLTGELTPAIAHSMQYPQVVPSICVFSVLGYASVSFILGMIKFFGATEAEIVKSCRKVLSIVISFVLFPKALNWKYIAGFVTVVGSIGWTFQLKQEKIAAKKAAKEAEKNK